MSRIEIYDPAMCCSTGVCGPSVDAERVRIASAVKALQEKGFDVKRYGLSIEPQAFKDNKLISALLEKNDAKILPATLLDGEIVKTKEYPSNEELSQWLGVTIDSPTNRNRCCPGQGCC